SSKPLDVTVSLVDVYNRTIATQHFAAIAPAITDAILVSLTQGQRVSCDVGSSFQARRSLCEHPLRCLTRAPISGWLLSPRAETADRLNAAAWWCRTLA